MHDLASLYHFTINVAVKILRYLYHTSYRSVLFFFL